jgi:urea transport system substrate-binding protein
LTKSTRGRRVGQADQTDCEDGASDWPTFATKAGKLLQQDKVAVVFGCWTSASRKAVKACL